MDKDTILAKSRQEHKDKDLVKNEIEVKAGSVGVFSASVLATVFFVVQILVGRGVNFGLYAIMFSVGAAQFIMKAVYLKRRREVVLAVVYTAVTVALSALYIIGLVAGQGG